MTSIDKLILSSCIIKKAYASYMPGVSSMAPVQADPTPRMPVPKAIPIPSARVVSNKKTSAPKVNNTVTRRGPISPSVYQPILDVIRKGEAGSAGYDTMVGSNKPFGLTNKTLQQVLDLQKSRLKSKGGTAAGGYQILNENLKSLAAQHKHDLNKTMFDRNVQDTYARSLMDRRGFQDFLNGKLNANQMRMNLAKEWAALPAKGERSFYHGVGNNKARVSSKDINSAIQKALELHRKATTMPSIQSAGKLP